MPLLVRLRATEERTSTLSGSRHAGDITPDSQSDSADSGGVVAASALVSSALIAEGVQVAGTAILLFLAQRYTGTSSPVEVPPPSNSVEIARDLA